jgi:hypothetical protein
VGSISDLLVVLVHAGVDDDNVFAKKEGRSDAYGLGALLRWEGCCCRSMFTVEEIAQFCVVPNVVLGIIPPESPAGCREALICGFVEI